MEAAAESVRAFLMHEARGAVVVGALRGELPPHPAAAGRAPRRALARLQGVGWACETRNGGAAGG